MEAEDNKNNDGKIIEKDIEKESVHFQSILQLMKCALF